MIAGSTSPVTTKSLERDGIGTGSASPMIIKSSLGHGIGLGLTSTVTTKSSVDHGIGSASSTRTATADDGDGSVQHRSLIATRGGSINLTCITENEDTPFWDYYPHRRSRVITVYNGGQHREDLDARFTVDMEGCRVYKCRLMIENVQLGDAGRFVCLQSHSANTHLSLTVLGPYTTIQ